MSSGARPPLRPVRLLLTTLETKGPLNRGDLWKSLAEKPDNTIKSKAHMKRIMRDLVRRGLINAKTDVKAIQELAPTKHLTAKSQPPFLFKLKFTKRYNDVNGSTEQSATETKQ